MAIDLIGAAAESAPRANPNSSGLQSLKDFTDVNKLMNPADMAGVNGGLTDIGNKFKDMGAKFKSPADASNMLKSMEIPSVPSLNAAAPSLSKLMGDIGPKLDSLTGTGKGTLGMPDMEDFAESVCGGPSINYMNTTLGANSSNSEIRVAIDKIYTMINATASQIRKAGVDWVDDTSARPPSNLSTCMSFGQNLHKLGANTTGSGVSTILKRMANTHPESAHFGDSIKSSLAEGKNKVLMSANGIRPLDYSSNNPFGGLPSAGSDNSISDDSARKLLGG